MKHGETLSIEKFNQINE
jgi:hypothetical protein